MDVQIVLGHIDDAAGDVGAVVGGTLQIRQQVCPHKARLDAALAFPHPQDVTGTQLLLQQIHHLFQRLHGGCRLCIPPAEGICRPVQDLLHGSLQHLQIRLGGLAEGQPLVLQLLGRFHDVHGVVGNALEVPDGLQQFRGVLTVRRRQGLAAELHQIGSQNVLIVIRDLLVGPHLLRQRRGIVRHRQQTAAQGLHGAVRHLHGHLTALAQRQSRGGQQTLIQLRLVLRSRGVVDDPQSQLLQQRGHGHENGHAQQVKGGVDHGDARQGGRLSQNGRGQNRPNDGISRQQHRRADHIEGQVDECGTLGVLIGPHRGQQRRDAGADVLAHDDGNGGAIAHLTGDGQRLQDPHGGGAGLDDGRQHRTGQQAQHRVLKGDEQLSEGRHIRQTAHGGGHGFHAEHQRGKAQQHRAGVLFLIVLAEHEEDDTHQRQHRRKGGGLQEPHPYAVAADAAQTQQPCRHRGADIGPHDDVDGLPQGHETGVDEAHHHHRGGRGALDHRRDAKAREKARQTAGGHLAQQGTQAAPGPAFQRLSHQRHAEQEQTQPSQHGQYIKNTHKRFPLRRHRAAPFFTQFFPNTLSNQYFTGGR